MTVDPEMMKILQNLQNAEQLHEQKQLDRSKGIVNVSSDSKEMYDILKRLDDATTNVAETIIKEKDTNPVSAVGIMQDNTITMGGYSILMEKKNLTSRYRKTFYHIKHGNTILHSDVALFESAMGILKGLVISKIDKTESIIELDNKYASLLLEAAEHKERARKLTESVKQDVALAKQSSAMDKAAIIKKQIKAKL